MKTGDDRVRERVMRSAADRVFTAGVRGWSMDDVAADSGITKRTLYKIVPSKEELVERVVMGLIRTVQTDISALIDEGGDFRSVTEAIMAGHHAFFNRMQSRAMQEIYLEYPAVEEKVYSRRAELTERLIAFFEAEREKGSLRADVAPGLILELFQAIVLYFIRFASKDEGYADRIREAFGCVLYGIIPRREETEASPSAHG